MVGHCRLFGKESKMAFNNLGSAFWLDVGQSVGWWYNFGNNNGAQYAMANCITPDAQMQTNWQAAELNDDGSVTYFVGFTNNGPQACFHNLNGGGLT
jgi:hypothetical protein